LFNNIYFNDVKDQFREPEGQKIKLKSFFIEIPFKCPFLLIRKPDDNNKILNTYLSLNYNCLTNF
jgi:hypothetical protein